MGKHDELVGLDMKRSMEDLFFKYKVNVAFSGHVHAYERFLPIYKNVTTLDATIYMTVRTGGQSYGTQLLLTTSSNLPLSPRHRHLNPLMSPLSASPHPYRLQQMGHSRPRTSPRAVHICEQHQDGQYLRLRHLHHQQCHCRNVEHVQE